MFYKSIKNHVKIIIADILYVFSLFLYRGSINKNTSFLSKLVSSIDDEYHFYIWNYHHHLFKCCYKQINIDLDKYISDRINDRNYDYISYMDSGYIRYPNIYTEKIFLKDLSYSHQIYYSFMLSDVGQKKMFDIINGDKIKLIMSKKYLKNPTDITIQRYKFMEL